MDIRCALNRNISNRVMAQEGEESLSAVASSTAAEAINNATAVSARELALPSSSSNSLSWPGGES